MTTHPTDRRSHPPVRRAGAGPAAALVATLSLLAPAAARADAPAGAAPPAGALPVRAAPVLFFWASSADAQVRARLAPAALAAARAAGVTGVDLSPPVQAPPDLSTRVARGVAAYDAMRFPDAVFEFDQAATAAAEHGAWGLSREALVDLFLYRGLARTETNDTAGAWGDFVQAATLDPTRLLDPARFRPSAIKSFARAVQEVTARPKVALSISAPPGSRIHLDGRATGRDQVTESLLPGEHYLWVERPAALPFTRSITVSTASHIDVPADAATPPADAALRRRAAQLGAGTPLLAAVRREGGVTLVELRSLSRGGPRLRGVVRLGMSPEADARGVSQAVTRALDQMTAESRALVPVAPPPGHDTQAHWYQNRWLWLAAGAAGALLAVSPFLFSSSGGENAIPASIDPGSLGR